MYVQHKCCSIYGIIYHTTCYGILICFHKSLVEFVKSTYCHKIFVKALSEVGRVCT